MRRKFLIRAFVGIGMLLGASRMVAEEQNATLRFAYVMGNIPLITYTDLRLGYDFLAKKYARNYDLSIDATYQEDVEAAIRAFTRGAYTYLGMDMATAALQYAAYEPYLGDVYVSSQAQTLLERYLAVVAIDAPRDVQSFEGKRAVLSSELQNSAIYADMVSLKGCKKRYTECFKIIDAQNPNRALLKLFFGQADIAFVPQRSWEMAKLMNPAMEKKLRVLLSSREVFGYGIEMFHKNIDPVLQKRIAMANDDIQVTEDGKQLMRIMKVAKRERIEGEKLKSYLEYYIRYFETIKALDSSIELSEKKTEGVADE